MRIDFNGPPHINTDGTKIGRSHIHIYKEMENDTGNLPWAYELDKWKDFTIRDTGNRFMDVFNAFCDYLHIDITNVQGVF